MPFMDQVKESVADVVDPITSAMQAATEPITATFTDNRELRAAAIGWVAGVVSTLLTVLAALQIK